MDTPLLPSPPSSSSSGDRPPSGTYSQLLPAATRSGSDWRVEAAPHHRRGPQQSSWSPRSMAGLEDPDPRSRRTDPGPGAPPAFWARRSDDTDRQQRSNTWGRSDGAFSPHHAFVRTTSDRTDTGAKVPKGVSFDVRTDPSGTTQHEQPRRPQDFGLRRTHESRADPLFQLTKSRVVTDVETQRDDNTDLTRGFGRTLSYKPTDRVPYKDDHDHDRDRDDEDDQRTSCVDAPCIRRSARRLHSSPPGVHDRLARGETSTHDHARSIPIDPIHDEVVPLAWNDTPLFNGQTPIFVVELTPTFRSSHPNRHSAGVIRARILNASHSRGVDLIAADHRVHTFSLAQPLAPVGRIRPMPALIVSTSSLSLRRGVATTPSAQDRQTEESAPSSNSFPSGLAIGDRHVNAIELAERAPLIAAFREEVLRICKTAMGAGYQPRVRPCERTHPCGYLVIRVHWPYLTAPVDHILCTFFDSDSCALAEGMVARSLLKDHKKKLPFLVRRIGVLSSATVVPLQTSMIPFDDQNAV